jgi:hypothetical protein
MLGDAPIETRLFESIKLSNKDGVVVAAAACRDECRAVSVDKLEVATFVVAIPVPVPTNNSLFPPCWWWCEISKGLINELGCIGGLPQPGLMIKRKQV